jgi:hypothetical protein
VESLTSGVLESLTSGILESLTSGILESLTSGILESLTSGVCEAGRPCTRMADSAVRTGHTEVVFHCISSSFTRNQPGLMHADALQSLPYPYCSKVSEEDLRTESGSRTTKECSLDA